MSQRDITIDIAKGIGIFLVVLGHVPIPMWLATPIYIFHMPLFFFLSGMFFHLNEDRKMGLYKKIRTLIIPYFFFAFCGNTSNVLRDLLFYHTVNIKTVFDLFNGAASPLWFLICLFGCYLLSRISSLFTWVSETKRMLIGSLLWGCIGILLCRFQIELPLWGTQILLMQFYFVLGYLSRNVQCLNTTFYNTIVHAKRLFIAIALIGFIACCLPFAIRPNVSTLDFYHPVPFFIGSLLGIFLCIRFSNLLSHINCGIKDLICKMGNKSLFILGFHFYVLFHLYFIAIPLLTRIANLWNIEFTGEYLRNCYWVGIFLVLPSIWISMILGKICMGRLKFFFKVS